mmetsp:Transcript_51012/g.108370  ORF Transcript_51012/g.108370 Transcript_51012/m.108370 type:complete len:200 (-) Transcript_51012:772-1371(-)
MLLPLNPFGTRHGKNCYDSPCIELAAVLPETTTDFRAFRIFRCPPLYRLWHGAGHLPLPGAPGHHQPGLQLFPDSHLLPHRGGALGVWRDLGLLGHLRGREHRKLGQVPDLGAAHDHRLPEVHALAHLQRAPREPLDCHVERHLHREQGRVKARVGLQPSRCCAGIFLTGGPHHASAFGHFSFDAVSRRLQPSHQSPNL